MEYIDFHAHLQPSSEARETLLKRMSANGISQAVVVAGGVVSREKLSNQIAAGVENDAEVPNQRVLDLCEGSSGRLLPFYFANPHRGVLEYVRLADRFYGLKLGPAVHGVALTDPRHTNYFEVALEVGHPVYLHCLERPGFDIAALIEVAKEYSALTFVLGHAGIGNCDFRAVDLIKDQTNICFETSGGFSSVVAYAVSKLGSDRVLFGSEYPLQDPEIELTKMRVVGLTPEILNANARRLLRRTV